MSGARPLKEKDHLARAFIDGDGDGFVCVGYMPLEFAAGQSAALLLTKESARAIKKMETKAASIKAGNELATDIARARWRKEKGRVVAETDFFAHTFTPTRDGWRLSECRMLWTARVDLRAYLHIFGDFSHSPARGNLPDFYLRDLTAEEIKESGLREGAVLSVSSVVMKKMGRTYMHKASKREKQMRATLNEWRDRGGALSGKLRAKRAKNAWVISPGGKRG